MNLSHHRVHRCKQVNASFMRNYYICIRFLPIRYICPGSNELYSPHRVNIPLMNYSSLSTLLQLVTQPYFTDIVIKLLSGTAWKKWVLLRDFMIVLSKGHTFWILPLLKRFKLTFIDESIGMKADNRKIPYKFFKGSFLQHDKMYI